tara:strand:+ start:1317 stop:1673 length:357 start_codon:yes stop_codon:yes gene_type:complete
LNIKTFLLGIMFFSIGQTLGWLNANGQFFNSWIKDNPILISAAFGIPIGLCSIYGTQNLVLTFDGAYWPARLLSFASGIFIFTILTWLVFKEGINIKTATILALASIIIILQVFWKYE